MKVKDLIEQLNEWEADMDIVHVIGEFSLPADYKIDPVYFDGLQNPIGIQLQLRVPFKNPFQGKKGIYGSYQ